MREYMKEYKRLMTANPKLTVKRDATRDAE